MAHPPSEGQKTRTTGIYSIQCYISCAILYLLLYAILYSCLLILYTIAFSHIPTPPQGSEGSQGGEFDWASLLPLLLSKAHELLQVCYYNRRC
jgi:hypothetical protein